MRTVTRNSVARNTIRSQRVAIRVDPTAGKASQSCVWCGGWRQSGKRLIDPSDPRYARGWLYRFHVDDDQGPRRSGAVAGGKLFCSRGCCESYTGAALSERGR